MIRTAVAAMAVAIGALSVLPPAAQAKDHRPCVSLREYRGAWKHDPADPPGVVLARGYTRRELETRWDVVGLGFPVETNPLISAVGVRGPMISIGYPRCGFSTSDAWFGATYRKRAPHYMEATTSHRVNGVQPHGHP